MTNPDSLLKSRDITLPTKVHIVTMVYPVVMYKCENWTIKKAEHQRIDAFKLWCWRRLLRVPWTAKRSNESILKEINSEYSLEGLLPNWSFNTLATRCKELTHWKRPWCWERLRAGGEGGDRGWDGWMVSSSLGICSNSCPLSRWCHQTISSSATFFSFCLESFPASGSFSMS